MELGRGDEAEVIMRECVQHVASIWGPESRAALLALDESKEMFGTFWPSKPSFSGGIILEREPPPGDWPNSTTLFGRCKTPTLVRVYEGAGELPLSV